MREIVQIHCGQTGINIGSQFWSLISAEHGINGEGKYCGGTVAPSQHQQTNINFCETSSGTFIPRAVLFDMEPGAINDMQSGNCGGLFRPDNYIHGYSGCSGNWGKGYYTEGAELCDVMMDAVRREAERCDAIQCFQMVHGLGGGTGSGLGSLLLEKTVEELPDVLRTSYSVLPSPRVPDVVVGPYNAVLTMHHLVENCHLTFLMDNEALFDLCSLRLKLPEPKFSDLNSLVAMAMSGVTSSMRFGGQMCTDMRKLAVNMISFPRVHFLMTSIAPLFARRSATTFGNNSDNYQNDNRDKSNHNSSKNLGNNSCNNNRKSDNGRSDEDTLDDKDNESTDSTSIPPPDANIDAATKSCMFEELTQELFDGKNTLVACNPQQGRYLTVAAMFRGQKISMGQIDEQVWKMRDKNSSLFAEWIPDSFKTSLCDVAPPGYEMAGTCVLNNTSVLEHFRRMGEVYTAMLRRKAFLHSYKCEGMDEMEFTEAESNLNDLVCEYQGAATGGCLVCQGLCDSDGSECSDRDD